MNKKGKITNNKEGYSLTEANKIISEYVELSTARLRTRLLKSYSQPQNKRVIVHA